MHSVPYAAIKKAHFPIWKHGFELSKTNIVLAYTTLPWNFIVIGVGRKKNSGADKNLPDVDGNCPTLSWVL
jgi:hypothetical protein